MNRKIVFRGKCAPDTKYAGEWVTGGYVPLSEGITPNNEGLIMRFLGGNITITYHVVPNTVGQFTGLQDSNGSDIYEGDILRKNDTNEIYEILWDEDYLTFAYRKIGSSQNYALYTIARLLKHSTIIGNIYDNPELLKGGEK